MSSSRGTGSPTAWPRRDFAHLSPRVWSYRDEAREPTSRQAADPAHGSLLVSGSQRWLVLTVSARQALAEEADRLRLPPAGLVLTIKRTYKDEFSPIMACGNARTTAPLLIASS